jgi:hypothetical protein
LGLSADRHVVMTIGAEERKQSEILKARN